MKILVVEDEERLNNSLVKGLQLQGYVAVGCLRGDEAELLIHDNDYDLVVLDINLPGEDGISVLKQVREYNDELKILLLTANSALDIKVMALDCGANDYLTKPFHFEELCARIRNLLRRKTFQENAVLTSGPLCFDTRSLEACVGKTKLSLTAKEASILHYLLTNKGCIVSQQDLLEHVWSSSVDEFSNSVRMHISSLRRKIRTACGEDIINNIIGKGYIIKGENNEA